MAAPNTGGFKSRAPPPPLRLHSSTFSSSSNGRSPSATHRQTSFDATHSGASTPTANHKLLYELPPSSSSPRLRGSRENSRTRQTNYRPMQSLGGEDAFDTGDDNVELTSPLSRNHRPRSLTPSHTNSLIAPRRSDLEAFALNCKAWFFAQDAAAGKAMTSALAAVPPNQKATYTKLQASVRSAYHTWTSLNRLRDFQALVDSTAPGSSLSARGMLSSPQAKKERATRFSQFVKLFCTPSAPGTHPFFEGLHTVLRLQTLPETLGGAGGRRICWEIDDAVFLESGGKDFMSESIVNLKGILGFESRKPKGSHQSYDPAGSDSDTDSSLLEDVPSQPQVDLTPRIITSPVAAATTTILDSDSSNSLYLRTAMVPQNRGRAHSDPFSDPSQVVNSPLSCSRPSPLPTTDSEMLASQHFPPASPSYATFQQHDLDLDSLLSSANDYRPPTQRELDLIHTPQYRVWTTPSYLTNHEIVSGLLSAFPSFITKKPVPRFTVTKGMKGDEEIGKLRRPDLEEGAAMITVGTGKIWISFDEGCARDEGWKVGLWTRFVLWVKGVFR